MARHSEPNGHNGQHNQTNGNGEADAAPNDEPMPIAIVGISCRLPGDATDPEQLWNMISEGRSAWSEVPPDRYNIDAFHHPSGDRQGTVRYIFLLIPGVGKVSHSHVQTFLR